MRKAEETKIAVSLSIVPDTTTIGDDALLLNRNHTVIIGVSRTADIFAKVERVKL